MVFFRNVFSELSLPFFLACGMISLLVLMQRLYTLADLIIDQHFPLSDVGWMLLYLLPEVFLITIPLGLVAAVFVVVIRHSMESELIALRSMGYSLWRYALPVFLFSLICTFVASICALWLIPLSQQRYSDLQVRLIKEHADKNLLPGVFNYRFGEKAIQITRREAEDLFGIFIADTQLEDSSPIITAYKGRVEVGPEGDEVFFQLQDGTLYAGGKEPQAWHEVNFSTMAYRLAFKGQNSHQNYRSSRLPTVELLKALREKKVSTRRQNRLWLELYSRLFLPWTSLAFALAAIPMAIVEPRSGKTGSFLRAVFLVLAYYVLLIGVRDLIKAGSIPPHLLGFPLVLIAVYGILRLWQLNAFLYSFSSLWRK